MKTLDEIQDEIKAILYQFSITPTDTALLAVSVYVAHEITNAKQEIFDAITEKLEKRGLSN